MDDSFYPGENEEFGGELIDDGYLHAIRILRDRDSAGVRFEVTPRGLLRKVPVWTAFVTRYIGDTRWIKRVSLTSAKVQVEEIHPYVFCEGYNVPKGRNKKDQLTFTSIEDANDFVECFRHVKT